MLFLLTFLIFEFCMTIYTYSVLGNAAREGVRYAIAAWHRQRSVQRAQHRL
jgi:Flp pilus assembly protein TadG